MTDEKPAEKKPRSKRICVLWGVALAVLLAAGLLCWLVVVPVLEVRRAIDEYNPDHENISGRLLDWPTSEVIPGKKPGEIIEMLGGRKAAIRKLRLYDRLPDWAIAGKGTYGWPNRTKLHVLQWYTSIGDCKRAE